MFNIRKIKGEKIIGRVVLAGIFSLCLGPQLLAKELGKYGAEYDIEEQPFIEMITERLEQVDIEAANKELEQRARAEVSRPKPYKLLNRASKDKKYYFDPTITLQQDVKTPEGKIAYYFRERFIFFQLRSKRKRLFIRPSTYSKLKIMTFFEFILLIMLVLLFKMCFSPSIAKLLLLLIVGLTLDAVIGFCKNKFVEYEQKNHGEY